MATEKRREERKTRISRHGLTRPVVANHHEAFSLCAEREILRFSLSCSLTRGPYFVLSVPFLRRSRCSFSSPLPFTTDARVLRNTAPFAPSQTQRLALSLAAPRPLRLDPPKSLFRRPVARRFSYPLIRPFTLVSFSFPPTPISAIVLASLPPSIPFFYRRIPRLALPTSISLDCPPSYPDGLEEHARRRNVVI